MGTKFQVIGWYSNVLPGDRTRETLSDGAMFSTRSLAEQYAVDHNMHVKAIVERGSPPGDPEVDWTIKLGEWIPKKGAQP